MFQTESYKGRAVTCVEFHTNMNDDENYSEEWCSIQQISAKNLDSLIRALEISASVAIFGSVEEPSETLISKAGDRCELQMFFVNTGDLGDVCAFIGFNALDGEEIEADIEF